MVIAVPTAYPVPVIKYLDLGAAYRIAQCPGCRSGARNDWATYRKIDAAFRRYTQRLGRLQ